jgi:N utilization substance protein A
MPGQKIKLSSDDIGLINLFESVTRAGVKDCIVDQLRGKITFVVNEGQAGMAIGKAGINIKTLQEKLKKRIEILEYSNDPIKFVANVFRPIKLHNAYVSERSDGKKTIHISVSKDRPGMLKVKMRTTRELLPKYFDFDETVFN